MSFLLESQLSPCMKVSQLDEQLSQYPSLLLTGNIDIVQQPVKILYETSM
jgi:hypothetical protein